MAWRLSKKGEDSSMLVFPTDARYGNICHIDGGVGTMKRTTILLDEDLVWAAEQIGEAEGKTFSGVLREAVAEYVTAHRGATVLDLAGIGSSGQARNSEHVHEILHGAADPIKGFGASEKTTPANG
jgi:predicted transcriptional regulator